MMHYWYEYKENGVVAMETIMVAPPQNETSNFHQESAVPFWGLYPNE